MAIRLPHGATNLPAGDAAHAAFEAELLNEKVASLTRVSRVAEKALADLAAFAGDVAGPEHDALCDAAAARVWEYLVQRELCGFADTASVVSDLAVPPIVRKRLGVAKKR